MINSDFDRVIRRESDYEKKGGKAKKIILIIIIILIIGAGVLGYLYYLNYQKGIAKTKFFQYANKTSINKIVDFEFVNPLKEKLVNSPVKIINTFSIKSDKEEDELSKYNLKLNYYKNLEGNQKIDLNLEKEENSIIQLSSIFNNEKIGIKSDEIADKYLGTKYENISKIEERISDIKSTVEKNTNSTLEEENSDQSENTFQEIDVHTNANRLDFSKEEKIENIAKLDLMKYKNLIFSKLTEDKFTVENNAILTDSEGKSQNVQVYELKLEKDSCVEILNEIRDTLLREEDFINSFVIDTESESLENNLILLANGYKIKVKKNDLKKYIEDAYEKIYDEISKIESFNFKIDLYVNENNVIKKEINVENFGKIEIEYISDNEIKITALKGVEEQNKNGFSIYLKRDNTNNSINFNIELSIVENMQINNKIVSKMGIVGIENNNSCSISMEIEYSNTTNKYKLSSNSEIDFDNVEDIENLDSENCYFLDEFDYSTFKGVYDQLEIRSLEVYNSKKQIILNGEYIEEEQQPEGEEELVNIGGTVEEEEEGQEEITEEENLQLKEEAKQKLISAISQEMGKAEQEGRDYILTDLSNLSIEGSNLTVVVNETLAIVAIDGYSFCIDPNFTLTEN